jgi:uncharacterized protein (DUF2141 family)
MRLGRLALLTALLAGIACAGRTVPAPAGADITGAATARLTVRVLGVQAGEGHVALALYATAGSFRKRTDAVASDRIAPQSPTVDWTVEGLQPGTYAVAVYQDLNGNGRLDRPGLGPPSEPYGFSNDARGTFGPPRFDRAAFDVGPGSLSIEITLR